MHLDRSLKSMYAHLILTSNLMHEPTAAQAHYIYLLAVTPLMFNLDNDMVFKLPVFPLPGETLNRFYKYKDVIGNDFTYIHCSYEVTEVGSSFKIGVYVHCYKLCD